MTGTQAWRRSLYASGPTGTSRQIGCSSEWLDRTLRKQTGHHVEVKRADDEALRWLFLLYLSVTVEHVEQLLVLQHDGSFHQVLKVRVDSRSDSGILSHPLLRQDVDVVPHLDGQTDRQVRQRERRVSKERVSGSDLLPFVTSFF